MENLDFKNKVLWYGGNTENSAVLKMYITQTIIYLRPDLCIIYYPLLGILLFFQCNNFFTPRQPLLNNIASINEQFLSKFSKLGYYV